MKSKIKSLVVLSYFLASVACKKPPYKSDTQFMAAYVIGKENCHTDPKDDYWLLDCTLDPHTPQVGDTIVINSETYTNVIKVKGLAPHLQQLGEKVAIEFKTITANRIITSGCEVASPNTYALKEMFIINQGYAR